jgi:hypothetical protein
MTTSLKPNKFTFRVNPNRSIYYLSFLLLKIVSRGKDFLKAKTFDELWDLSRLGATFDDESLHRLPAAKARERAIRDESMGIGPNRKTPVNPVSWLSKMPEISTKKHLTLGELLDFSFYDE